MTPGDLNNHQLLRFATSDFNNWRITDKQGKLHLISNKSKMICNNSDFINEMAISGHGIMRSPTFISRKAIAAGKLIPILKDCIHDEMYLYAIYPKTRFLPQSVSVFIDFLAERFGETPYWDHKLV